MLKTQRKKYWRPRLLLASATVAVLTTGAWAQESTGEKLAPATVQSNAAGQAKLSVDQSVTVYGWRNGNAAPLELATQPITDPASVSVIEQQDLQRQVTTTPGDLLRGTTGVQVSDYGQPGEAQGITMRGWSNGYDGGFVSYTQDGFQRNQPSNISVNGYLDINPLIPETVDQITVVRGPSDVRYGGDFAQAGSIVVKTRDYIPTSISVSGGSFGEARVFGVYGLQGKYGSYYTAVDAARTDGYRDNSNNKQLKTFSKFSTNFAGGHFTAGLETYVNQFHLPGYLDLGLIQSGALSAQSAVNKKDHGLSSAYALTANYTRGTLRQGLEIVVYGGHDSFERYNTTTPYPQFYRDDRRWVSGGNADQHWNLKLFGQLDSLIQIGAGVQDHSVGTNKYPSSDGAVDHVIDASNSYDYNVAHYNQLNSDAYGALTVKPTRWLKLDAGVRYDHFYYDVAKHSYNTTSNTFVANPFTSGSGHVSPKVGFAVQLQPTVTVFGNFAESPNSPNAVTELPSNPKLDASYLRNQEIGVSYDSRDGRYHLQVIGYQTLNQNEIGEVGYQEVNYGQSHRNGYDLEGAVGVYRSANTTAKVTANYTRVSATLSGGGYVPYLSNWLASYGFQLEHTQPAGKLVWTVNHDFYGPQRLDSGAAFTSNNYNRLGSKLSYNLPAAHGLQLWAGAVFYPGDRYSEFAFDLSNRVYTNPEPRAQVKFGLSLPLAARHSINN